MIHDLIVNFYCKSADKGPKYRAPVGIFTKDEKVLSKEGFKRAGEGYYRDYEKEISETELPKWTEEEYVSEVMDILYSGDKFEKIILEALEIELYDGMFPPRMVQLKSGIDVIFSDTEPMSPVIFQKEGDGENAESFTLPLHYLKAFFGVLTLFEVMSRLEKFGENLHWTLEEWKQHIKENKLTL